MRFLGKYTRKIPNPSLIPTQVHSSLKERYDKSDYTTPPIENFIKEHGKWPDIVD